MEPKNLLAFTLVAGVACYAGLEPLTYSNPVVRNPSVIPQGPFMDSAVQKLEGFRLETRRLEDSASKVCLTKASATGFSDPAAFESCQKGSQELIAKREQSSEFFRNRVQQESFRRHILGWTAIPVRSLDQADFYYGFDRERLRAASEVDFSFSGMARPSVGVVAWEDYLLLFRYSLSLHLPSGEDQTISDKNRSVLDRISTVGGSVSPKVEFPLLTYAGADKHLSLEFRGAVPFDIPGMGTVHKDVVGHLQAGVGGSALLVGRRDVLGVILTGDAKYLYGFSKEWRDQLGFANEDGFGLARGGIGLQVYNRLTVLAGTQLGLGGKAGDVVAADYPVSFSVSISR